MLKDMFAPALHGVLHGLAIGWPLVALICVAAVGRVALRRHRSVR